MTDNLSEIVSGMKNKRIEAPESFADDIMLRILQQKEGGFKSLTVPTRILLSTIVIAVYCSLGILLGAKGYEDMKLNGESSSQDAIIDLMESHHIDTDFMHDYLFITLNNKE